jgi:hypothetical protein
MRVEKLFSGDVTHGMCDTGDEEESPCTHVKLRGKEALIVIYDDAIKASVVKVLSDEFQTQSGVKVGMLLADLVAKNGKPFGLTVGVEGVDVTEANGGSLERGLAFSLAGSATDLAAVQTAANEEATLPSTSPVLAKLDLRVASIGVSLVGAMPIASEEGGNEHGAAGCSPSGHYGLDLAWTKNKCQLEPASMKKAGFVVAKSGTTFAATLDEGVQTVASSTNYENITIEKVDGCNVQVKFWQPPSHRVWASLTFDLAIKGTAVTGKGVFDESVEGDTCTSKVAVTGTYAP